MSIDQKFSPFFQISDRTRVVLNRVSVIPKWVSMEITLILASLGFFLLLLTWVSVDIFKQRTEDGDEQLKHGAKDRTRSINLVKI